jgi:hypothetical protein
VRTLLVLVFVAACRDRKPPPPPPPPVGDAAPIIDAAPDAFVPVWYTNGAQQLEDKLRTERDVAKAMAAFDDAQLRTLHGGFDCRFAFDAAVLLAERGDRSRLPVRGGENDPERLARKLCLISTIYEAEKRRPYLVEYVAPTFRTSYEECRDDLPPGTEDTHVKKTHTRAALTGNELRQFLLHQAQPTCRAGEVQGEFICAGDGPGQSLEITLAPGGDGKLYISKIDGTRNTGCD